MDFNIFMTFLGLSCKLSSANEADLLRLVLRLTLRNLYSGMSVSCTFIVNDLPYLNLTLTVTTVCLKSAW